MRASIQHLGSAILPFAMVLAAAGQTPQPAAATVPDQSQLPAPARAGEYDSPAAAPSPAPPSHAVQQLLGFTDSDVKFNLRDLMDILSDRRHEGWVLAAYPDPKTGQPLIGAGFSLDLPAREHPQPDPLNPHPFLEPSSAELWQAAGLDPDHLHAILDQFDDRLAAWSKKEFRKRIKTLAPQITGEDATLLLRVGAIQAIYNAKGYCRNFDALSASQQMALSQLVYQMGVNLQEFNRFLGLINNDSASGLTSAEPLLPNANPGGQEQNSQQHWTTVQQSLVQSQWARLYRSRAVSVIAMLDPQYADGPGIAEKRVGAMLRPAVVHRRSRRPAASRQLASASRPSSKVRTGSRARGAKAHTQRKQRT